PVACELELDSAVFAQRHAEVVISETEKVTVCVAGVDVHVRHPLLHNFPELRLLLRGEAAHNSDRSVDVHAFLRSSLTTLVARSSRLSGKRYSGDLPIAMPQ